MLHSAMSPPVDNIETCMPPQALYPTWFISSCVAFKDLMMVSSWIFPAARLCSSWFSSCCSRPRSAFARLSSSSWLCKSDSWEWIWLCRVEIWGRGGWSDKDRIWTEHWPVPAPTTRLLRQNMPPLPFYAISATTCQFWLNPTPKSPWTITYIYSSHIPLFSGL